MKIERRFYFQLLIFTILSLILLFSIGSKYRVARIRGPSMKPTLLDNDYVLYRRDSNSPQKGDLIIIKSNKIENFLVKRVIAVSGDYLEIISGKVFINGKYLNENYIDEPWYASDFIGTIPKDTLYIMGDNRTVSLDSRELGLLKTKDIIGKIVLRRREKGKWHFINPTLENKKVLNLLVNFVIK